ncbi:FHA domain-containing protein [Mycolicibacterium fortuitum]|uniref:FHA domain-containing protein n=1 Tax=Mycolicibacterium fortuitum TaxID=1766 RepID=A0A378UEE2_MYCFO|nr:FHA domain-containing protein [Mycolicibacterium fortuitum]
MKVKRPEQLRETDRRRPVRQPARGGGRRAEQAQPRKRRPGAEQRPTRTAPNAGPVQRPGTRPARPKSASQAKARAKARKAKAPKVVRPPLRVRLRERLLVRLASIELNPRVLISRVPFVVLVIAALGVGLAVTLWLSTGSAERSYQLGHARQINQGLLQQKEALERDVLEAQAAPALAESARNLGMIPSRDTAHLVQDAAGNWTVVGTPKPAEGVPPPPLNTPLPEEAPPAPPAPPAPRVVDPRELTVRAPRPGSLALPGIPVPQPDAPHGVPGALPPVPGPVLPGPAAPAPEVLAAPEAPAPADLAQPAPQQVTDPTHVPAAGVPTAPGPVQPAPVAPAPAAQVLAAPAPAAPGPVTPLEQFSPPVAPAAHVPALAANAQAPGV